MRCTVRITGSKSGVGRETVEALAHTGAHMAIIGPEDSLQLKSGGVLSLLRDATGLLCHKQGEAAFFIPRMR